MFGRNKWTNSSASAHYLDVEAALAGVSETGFLAELTGGCRTARVVGSSGARVFKAVSVWMSDVLKIACGVVVGYGLLIVYATVFQLTILPVLMWLVG